jgi:hypothetical protein
MPVPVIVGAAAAIAARLASKAAPRIVGGIVGKGAAKINPVYKETGASVKVIPPKPEFARTAANFSESIRIQTVSSKAFKEGVAKNVNVGKPSKTIKINSNK